MLYIFEIFLIPTIIKKLTEYSVVSLLLSFPAITKESRPGPQPRFWLLSAGFGPHGYDFGFIVK